MTQPNTQKAWFSDQGKVFTGSEPFFYNPDEFSWVKQVEQQWQVIRDELYAQLKEDSRQLEPYVNGEMMTQPNKWRTLGLMFWNRQSPKNCAKFPETWKILSGIPNICAASFNVLEAGTTIKPHIGNTNAIIRCHLGLTIPAPAPKCAFRVGNETRSWDEGKFLMFCDAHEHTAWNNSHEDRYILVVDIMRPEFKADAAGIAGRVLGYIYHEAAYQKNDWLKKYFGSASSQEFLFFFYRMYYRFLVRLEMGRRT